jgi:hypothetical protein
VEALYFSGRVLRALQAFDFFVVDFFVVFLGGAFEVPLRAVFFVVNFFDVMGFFAVMERSRQREGVRLEP